MKANEIVTRDGNYVAWLKTISVEELKAELLEAFRVTAEHLTRMAEIVRELEDRGENLSEIRIPLLHYLRRIASGQVVPEAVVRFGQHPMLLARVLALPLDDQRRLAEGGTVPLAVRREGGIDHRQADPMSLSRDQIHQVLAPDHIRSPEEQLVHIERPKAERKRRAPAKSVRYDADAGELVVGRKRIAMRDVLAALDSEEPEEPRAAYPVTLQLSDRERRQIAVAAADADVSRGELVRRALVMAGIIRPEE